MAINGGSITGLTIDGRPNRYLALMWDQLLGVTEPEAPEAPEAPDVPDYSRGASQTNPIDSILHNNPYFRRYEDEEEEDDVIQEPIKQKEQILTIRTILNGIEYRYYRMVFDEDVPTIEVKNIVGNEDIKIEIGNIRVL